MTLNLVDAFRLDFRTSAEADGLNSSLQKAMQLDYRYQPARLALALSLSNESAPSHVLDTLGKPIRGETLFGQEEAELAIWVALISEHTGNPDLSRKDLFDLVAAHWARGVAMLELRLKNCNGDVRVLMSEFAKMPLEA